MALTDIEAGRLADNVFNVVGANKNLIINGAMQVNQRNAAATTNGAFSLDRFKYEVFMDGGCSVAQTTVTAGDAFTNGFRNALRVDVTTADTSLTGTQNIILEQRMEGQNLQSIAKGTSGAKEITLSFYVRGSTTGTYIAEMYDNDNTRGCSKSYTIDSADTWEYKTITYPADTTGTLDNDNGSSLWVNWWLGAGADFQSGTLQTTWAARVNANRAVGQTNLAASTSNYIEFTGVQLEVGSVATPFEHRSFGDELARCQRYYQKVSFTNGSVSGATTVFGNYSPMVEMRSSPSVSSEGVIEVNDVSVNSTQSAVDVSHFGSGVIRFIQLGSFSGLTVGNPCSMRFLANNNLLTLNAEL